MSMPQAAVALLGLALLASPAMAEDADLALPPVPEVTVSVEPPARPAAAAAPVVAASPAAASVDVTLPQPPDAPVTITVADRLPALLAMRLADGSGQLLPRLGKKEREAIAAFYALGGYKPLWVDDGAWTPAALALRERLARAGEEGLDPAGYPVPQIATGADAAAEAASAELKLSAAAVLYARDARGARIDPARLSRLITPKLELPAADAVLTALAAASDPGETLQRFNPQHPGYLALKRKLAEMRAGASPAKGRLEEDVVANLERWRWLPSDLGPRHILVNVPEFKLRLIDQGRLVHQARVIVGKPETPTPLFSDVMDHAIVNPSWNVPPSIFKNEFYSDPAYAASRGYQVVRTKHGISIRQPPGERNALGFIKFMFPNQHAVYLHDTPNRSLFNAQKRAFSHGCVRLDQPFRFGEFVLGPEWSEGRLRSLIGKGERTIRLPEKIPVHLTYFTLVADDKGELHQIADLYAVNNKVRLALGLPSDGTRVAAEAKPQRQARRRAPPRAQTAVRSPMPMYEHPGWWWVTR